MLVVSNIECVTFLLSHTYLLTVLNYALYYFHVFKTSEADPAAPDSLDPQPPAGARVFLNATGTLHFA